MTREEAEALFDAEFWKDMSLRDRAIFQMSEDRLCMPFGVFQNAVEKTIGRPVFTHEFGMNRDGLLAELVADAKPPTQQEIIEMIPEHMRVIVFPE